MKSNRATGLIEGKSLILIPKSTMKKKKKPFISEVWPKS